MSDLILHHYELSPFSEKVRRILAWKKLPWLSLRAPAVMPKPDLVALTGGYRKIPILQIANHVYCDTSLIARVLERFAPEPSLYAHPLAQTLAEWADSTLFDATVPIAMRPTRLDDIVKWLTPDEMNKFADDRRAMGEGARRMPPPGKLAKSFLAVYLARLEATLAASPYLLGSAPTIADFSAYHNVWFLKTLAPELLAGLASLELWRAKLEALPSTQAGEISSREAIELCRNAPPAPEASGSADPIGLPLGAQVVVRPLDYGRDPVSGTLFASEREELVLRREDERAGTVYVHFPRVGYEIAAQK